MVSTANSLHLWEILSLFATILLLVVRRYLSCSGRLLHNNNTDVKHSEQRQLPTLNPLLHATTLRCFLQLISRSAL